MVVVVNRSFSRKPGLGRQLGQLDLPGPQSVAVGAPGVGADEQLGGLGVAGRPIWAHHRPMRGHGEGGGVGVVADRHPAFVGAQVVDAVGDGLSHLGVDEVVDLGAGGRFLGLVLLPSVGVLADQLLLLGVDANDRLAVGQEPPAVSLM